MEVRQFLSRSINPLVTKTFACKWSEDDRLAVITEKNTQVFEIIPVPTQVNPILSPSRTFINPPETLPGNFYSDEVNSKIYDWEREDVYSFLMHDSYTPRFENAQKLEPNITGVFWSPRQIFHPQRCILALLTTAGAIELALQVDQHWISVYEFHSKWAELIDEEAKVLRDGKSWDAKSLKRQFERLIAVNATWSCIYSHKDGTNYAYLVIAYRNAEIVFYKIDRIMSDIVNIDVNVNVELKLKKKLIEPSVKVNCMHWVHLEDNSDVLIIGFFNGQIGILKLQEVEGEIVSNFFEMCYSDEDDIPVDFIDVLRQTDKWLEIVVVKGLFLLILVIDVQGKMISMKFISSPGFSITGAAVIDCNRVFITTQDGNFHMVQKSQDQQELTCSTIKLEMLRSQVQFLGLASSSNKMLYSIITSPSTLYDHLIDREPSDICFFSLPSTILDPIEIINKEQSFFKCWDCLKAVKINILKYNEIPRILYKLMVDLESLPLHQLRMVYWFLILMETLKKKNAQNVKPSEELEEAKTYIFLYSALSYLKRLLALENLNNLQRLCMSLLRNHLDIWYAGEDEEDETPLSQLVKQCLDETNDLNLTEQEKCNICNELITEPWASICPRGHKLPRCAITCLQVTVTKYRMCNVCQEIFHPCLDLEIDEVRCLYCDLPVFYKFMLPESVLLTSKKNLSKKKPLVTTGKEVKEET